VFVQELAPPPVSDARGELGRADDVGEQHGREHAVGLRRRSQARDELLDLLEHPVLIASPKEVVGSRDPHELRPGDVIGEVFGVADREAHGVSVVDHERRHADRWQDIANVAVVHHPHHRRRGARRGGVPLVAGPVAP
jgi:hypothetical protein